MVGAVPVLSSAQNAAPVGFSNGISLDVEASSSGSSSNNYSQDDSAQANTQDIPWWLSAQTNSELHVTEVGSYTPTLGQRTAIALHFSQPFAEDGAFDDQLAVYAPDTAQLVKGRWRRARSANILYFVVPGPGRYIVRIRAGLRDAMGHTFNHSLSGPVEIAPPP